jgi:spermidine synthase
MTVGALVVHRRPEWFSPANVGRACSRSALWFGISTIVALLTCLNTPFRIDTIKGLTLNSVYIIIYWVSVAALPFVFSGICVCAALTRFPRSVGKLYAADLVGAALGCLAIVVLLSAVDALSAIMLVSALTIIGSLAFAVGSAGRATVVGRTVVALGIVVFALWNTQTHAIRVQYALSNYIGGANLRHRYWNAFSYVEVSEPMRARFFHGAGSNAALAPSSDSAYIGVSMDTRAATALTRFNGRWEDVEWLMYDGTNLVQNIRPDGPVLVIGSGGGRDVLSSLLRSRGQRKVTGVDINPIMIDLLTHTEADFSGHLDRYPHTTLFNDEARSWVARSKEKFQVITIPLVDTSAASAAGAYALTENSLYTVEAFELFWDHLQDDGIVSVSRWWNGGRMGEAHRLAALAAETLRRKGVTDPRQHVVMGGGGDLSTLLLSKRAFSAAEVDALEAAGRKYGFRFGVTPRGGDRTLIAALEKPDWPAGEELAKLVDVLPPTDDRPFFFHSYKMSNLFRSDDDKAGVAQWDKDAMVILLALVLLVTVLAVGVVAVPWIREQRRTGGPRGSTQVRAVGYFAAIGVAFMFFESAQMQRLNLFLGYPIYALTVVLFGLLLSSSLGAFLFDRLARIEDERDARGLVRIVFGATLGVLVLLGVLTVPITHHFASHTTPVRIVVAALLVAPAGVCMGMFFPLGLRLCADRALMSLAWYWAVNGMASTCAAVYGIALAISVGFGVTYWASVGGYLVAGALALQLVREPAVSAVGQQQVEPADPTTALA